MSSVPVGRASQPLSPNFSNTCAPFSRGSRSPISSRIPTFWVPLGGLGWSKETASPGDHFFPFYTSRTLVCLRSPSLQPHPCFWRE